MRNEAVNLLGQLLSDNMGNRLTPALATGIATLFNQELMKFEHPPADASMASSEHEAGASTS